MKKLFVIFLTIFLALPTGAMTLKGGVTYTVESARKEAFANVEYTLPQKLIDSNLVDPNFEANKKAISKGKTELSDRYIAWFSDGIYQIVYKKDKYHEYYYNANGKLEEIGKRTGLECPAKSYVYNTQNKLIEVILYVSLKEGYTFEPNGQLTSHWIGNKGYDLNGNLINESH